jgi:hypothetical protein
MHCTTIINGKCSVVIYLLNVTWTREPPIQTKKTSPQIRFKLCGVSGETLWGWLHRLVGRCRAAGWAMCAGSTFLSLAVMGTYTELNDQTGQVSPLAACELALLYLPRLPKPLTGVDIISSVQACKQSSLVCTTVDDARLSAA